MADIEDNTNCCEGIAVNKKCKKCYNRHKAAYRKKIAEKERCKVTTRNALMSKRSKYSSVFCIDCKDKTKKDLCPECYKEYDRVAVNHCRKEKRQQMFMLARDIGESVPDIVTTRDHQNTQVQHSVSAGKIKLNKQNKRENTDNPQPMMQIEGENTDNPQLMMRIEGENTDNPQLNKKTYGEMCMKTNKKEKSVKKKKDAKLKNAEKKQKILSKKTKQNQAVKVKRELNYTPDRLRQVAEYIVETNNAKKSLNDKFDMVDKQIKLYGSIYQNKVENSPKGAEAYEFASAFTTVLKGVNVSTIKECFKLSYEKAKSLSLGEKVLRKPNIRKFPENHSKLIKEFYTRDDISRVDNGGRANLKGGPKRFLYFSVYTAYKLFQDNYPEIAVSESMFRLLKPSVIRFVSDIPLIACVCVYCENVRLMLFLFLGINNEYELYTKLICKRGDNQRFYSILCIKKLCPNCCDWEKTIRSLPRNDTDLTKEHKFRTWKAISEVNRSGKKVVRRSLQSESGSVSKCLDHLINAVINPGQGFTFVEHYFRQKYQYQMYMDCLDTLKYGECVLVQDFSKNKTLIHQNEIKASYWSQGQVSIHPTVIYYKTHVSEKSKRIVITHLSDINSHNAHLVYYMTKDCINILSKLFPGVQLKKVYVWSDGCASQYKGKTSFFYLDKFEVIIERNFFGSEHGKGESDAETGIISRQYLQAIRSNETVIMNASDLHEYLCEKNDKKFNDGTFSKIYRLVTDEDMKEINQKFEAVKVETLKGKCTRILHQIKPGANKGVLLSRNYSCFCNSCLNGDFENCENYQFTQGKFIERQLPSSSNDFRNNINANTDEDEEENGEEVDNELEIESENVDIVVEQKAINFSDLQVEDLVVVTIKSESGNIHQYVAKITEIESEKVERPIEIIYLRPKPEQPEVFYIHDKKDTDWVALEDILMKMPLPRHIHRGRWIFYGNVLLNRK